MTSSSEHTVAVGYRLGDALSFKCDTLAVKYAQSFYGLDQAVADVLRNIGVPAERLQPASGEHTLLATNGALGAKRVLMLGTPPLYEFEYANIGEFARRSLEILLVHAPDTGHVALTLHGPNFGLDPVECSRQIFAGVAAALGSSKFPPALRKVTVIERDPDRIEALQKALRAYSHASAPGLDAHEIRMAAPLCDSVEIAPSFAFSSEPDANQPRSVFVAMPFDKKMRTVWKYGIYQPVHAAGLNCERMDEVHFTGDVLERMKKLIQRAELVIADITGNNPNVFLELGYAWGIGRPTLLLSQRDESSGSPDLPFDVRTQRCLVYEDAVDLEEKLSAELSGLDLTRGT